MRGRGVRLLLCFLFGHRAEAENGGWNVGKMRGQRRTRNLKLGQDEGTEVDTGRARGVKEG